MSEGYFKVRDLRKKEQFIIDDVYLNGYARLMSPYATCVYLSLCRHADKEQKAFPSIKRIAQQFRISAYSVKRGIRELIFWNIVKKKRLGKRMSNVYWLLDKSEWKPAPSKVMAATQPSPSVDEGRATTEVMGATRPNDGRATAAKDTQGKDAQKKDVPKILREMREELIKRKVLPQR